MSRRSIAHRQRVLIPTGNEKQTRHWNVAVYVEGDRTERSFRPNHFFLARHGEDVTKPETERIACSVRYSRARRKAKKLGRKLHNVKAAGH